MADLPNAMRRPKPPKVAGIVVAADGRDWIVPPLALVQFKRLRPQISALSESQAGSDNQIDLLLEIVAAGMSRNYPDLSADELASLIDVGNADLFLTAVLAGSGLKAIATPAIDGA